MGVYINMEMPTVRDTLVLVKTDGTAIVYEDEAYVTTAVSVPKHGKLGDLNALAQQIEHKRFHHTHTDSLAARHHVVEYGHFLKAIIDAPTIIPASEEGEK